MLHPKGADTFRVKENVYGNLKVSATEGLTAKNKEQLHTYFSLDAHTSVADSIRGQTIAN